jgi:hypothetical protein
MISALRELYNSSPVAREILASFSEWEDKKVTSVKRLHRRLARGASLIDREQVVQFLQTLHAIGIGELIAGEGGRRPRFVWGYPLREVPRVASGETWELQPLQDLPEHGDGEPAGDREDDDDILGDQHVRRASIKHVFRLREDFSVKMRLPADLTAGEAFRLADFIKTLPFGL